MTRPRMVAVLSAIAASTSAFLVVSRGGLFGTAAGAVLFTLVNTLVSHWSHEGLDRVGGLLRRRRVQTEGSEGTGQTLSVGRSVTRPINSDTTPNPSGDTLPGGRTPPTRDEKANISAPSRTKDSRRPGWMIPWLVAACALASLGFSVYTLASPDEVKTVETVIVREQVVQKTVTVTTQATRSSPPAGYAQAADLAVSTTQAGAADTTADGASTTTTSVDGTEGTGSSSTTATTAPTDEGETSTSTTDPGDSVPVTTEIPQKDPPVVPQP